MKLEFMLLAGVLFLISCQNLHNYECDYFSIRIPDSWKFEIEQLPVSSSRTASVMPASFGFPGHYHIPIGRT